MKKITPSRRLRFNRTVGFYLRKNRVSAGLSPSQVISETGLSQVELQDYENGIKSIPAFIFARLIDLYRADLLEAQTTLYRASEFLRIH